MTLAVRKTLLGKWSIAMENNYKGEWKFNEDGKRMKLDVKKGDTVLIGKYSGTDIKIEDEEYTILREDEVLAIVE